MSLAERYADWSGKLGDLERELAHTVAAGDVTGIEPPNGRLIRHYQAHGAVDRPGRGPSARYGRRQLLQALAVKRLLADGWPLTKIADITSALDDDQLADTAVSARVPEIDPALHNVVASDPDHDARADAMSAVSALRGASGAITDPAARIAYASSMAKSSDEAPLPQLYADDPVRSRAAPAQARSTGRAVRAYAPAVWLDAYVDAEALTDLDDRDIDRAMRALASALKADKRNLLD